MPLNNLTWRETLTHPATVAGSIAAAVAHALGVAPVVAVANVLWMNVSTVFTAVSVAGLTLAPRVGWLPQGPLTAAALVAGGAYVLKLADRVYDDLQRRL